MKINEVILTDYLAQDTGSPGRTMAVMFWGQWFGGAGDSDLCFPCSAGLHGAYENLGQTKGLFCPLSLLGGRALLTFWGPLISSPFFCLPNHLQLAFLTPTPSTGELIRRPGHCLPPPWVFAILLEAHSWRQKGLASRALFS